MSEKQTRRKVVITGVGAITPLGHTMEQTWQRLQNAESGIDRISLFDASGFPTKIAAEVKKFDFKKQYTWNEPTKFLGRNSQFALFAAQSAIQDSKLDISAMSTPERCGVYLGSGEGIVDFHAFAMSIYRASYDGTVDKCGFIKEGIKALNPFCEFEQEPNMSAMHIAEAFGAKGMNSNCLTACAASSQAIGEASEIIRRGDADVMISGGTHSMIHPFGMTGFNLLTALSTSYADHPTKASRPFDRLRDGFILGEGSGMLILEELEHAKNRGAHIYGELIGYGSSADAFRVTDVHPDGRGAIAAIQRALKHAGIDKNQVDYINAHGTSTQVNDRVETKAIKSVFQERAYKIPVSSIKSMMGHLIAAAGAVELITCLLAIRDGVIPPTTNYENPDPECDLDYVPNQARKKEIRIALSNSFGFGGQNISLLIQRYIE